MLKQFKSILFLLCISLSAFGQLHNPVKWAYQINDVGELLFSATVDKDWHLYDMNLDPGGPIPTTFIFEEIKGTKLSGKVTTNTGITTQYDDLFGMNISWYVENPTFKQKIKLENTDNFRIQGYIEFMACNDETCVPGKWEFSLSKNDLPAALLQISNKTAKSINIKELPAPKENISSDTLVIEEKSLEVEAISDSPKIDLWQPVIKELNAFGTSKHVSDNSLLWIFLLGLGGGLIALFTPCIWPIIPMTVSFFLKKSNGNRKKSIQDALTYGIAIVVIYVSLGLLITLFFGASMLNEMSTSAIFNLLFFALLLIFAISFLGAFEITLPASWTNKMDKKAESTGGIISIFFIAFTLVLVSFSCTGPIIGTLLVEAASKGTIIGPAIGMFGFSLGLALPFALFALFPSWIKNIPKSGGWLNSVKVVLGFLELALALKFLSVADLAYGWGILDREVFLVLWIVIFALLGCYLLGKIKLPHDSDLKFVSVPRFFLAIASFAFALYMIPGLWGAPLKAISAFSPPLYTQDFNLYKGEVHPQFLDYEEGMAYAQKHQKPVLLDFTGYGCVNCREMEASVWSDPRVKEIIDNEYILISLYVDKKEKLPEIIEVEEYGKITKLRTEGDKWSYLQRHKFGTNAQPFYVLLDPNGIPIAPAYAYNKNVEEYLTFLRNK